MRVPRILAAGVVLLLFASLSLSAEKPRKPVPVPVGPPAKGAWYVDDEDVFANLMDKLAELAKAGKMLPHEKLKAKFKEGGAKVAAAKPGDKPLTPEEVYKAARPSVFIVGSVVKDADGEWTDGRYATAWVLTADGVLVSNWHVFAEMEKDETFGVSDLKGTVYPVTDFLGGDKISDVAIFKIAADKLTPLPVAAAPPEIGSWVGVVSHPGDQFYMFTQGHVSRYSKTKTATERVERWLNITADYATGSSGAPVLDRFGNVVGMAAMTVSVDYPDEKKPEPMEKPAPKDKMNDPVKPKEPPSEKGKPAEKPKAEEKPKEQPKEPAGDRGSTLQMVVKLAVPASRILRTAGEGPPPEKAPEAPEPAVPARR